MKKFIYTLGLSLLVYQSAWAQNVNPNPTNPDNAAAKQPADDLQTIFFSEDFLDELSDISKPTVLDDSIPLEKNTTDASEKSPDKIDIIYKPIQKPQTAPSAPVENAQKPAQAPVQPTVPSRPVVAPVTQPVASPAIDKTPTRQMPQKAEPSPAPIPTPVTETQKILPSTAPAPATQPQTAAQPTMVRPDASQRSTLPLRQRPAFNTAVPASSQSGSVLVRQPQSSLPKTSKSDAFSLDKSTPIPSSLIQDDAYATNILNKGINISPEQRAKMMMRKKYDEMDLNHDGIVSEDEFVQFKTLEAQKISVQVFRQIDRNGDHVLSDEEYDLLMNKMIDNYIKKPQ